jgi:hypothetical protein
MTIPIYLLITLLALAGCSDSATEVAEPSAKAQEPSAKPQEPSAAIAKLRSFRSGPCFNTEEIRTYCGFINPEDIVVTPENKYLVISEMGEFMTDAPGQLVLFDLDSNERAVMSVTFEAQENPWGEAGCPTPAPELFSPHGIDLITSVNGSHQLLVVNHGGREAVEMFELVNTGGHWQAEWRGCALPPEDAFINDVSGLNDGGFLVTHMWNKSYSLEVAGAKLLAGENTGWVWRWHPDTGFSKLENSHEMMPNGIVVSKDNQYAFVNIYMGSKTIRIDLDTGEKTGEFSVRQPDNITLDDEGNLWIASHQQDPLNETCTEVHEGACLLPFQIVRADPETMETEVFFEQRGEPMGYATAAKRIGNVLYLGTAHGDRIASIPVE